jgi:DNA gyrase subunit A
MSAPPEDIRDLLIEDEMKDSYLTFAMSVIMSRALPDGRDGLKPSQRRILVAMNDLNLGPRSKFRKVAKICGDCSGNYHPHGQEVVYPTLVRLAQDFNMRYPLVDGQGNFGSMDGDPPAAMRYIEARMSEAAVAMLDDLQYDTVDFRPNYDDTRAEPTVLPGKFPNLLANGCGGIAVGMATSIPPHNVREICDAIIALIENPDITIREIFEIIPGPDFPTGGLICGRAGIVDGYTRGRGTITLRARTHVEHTRSGKTSIVVTEIPYQMNRERICERLADLVKAGTIPEISDIHNYSNKDGTRIVIDLKRDADENVVLNQIFKHSPLQTTFSIIMIALVDGRPETLNIKQMLELYRDHRGEVIRRRTQFLLERAEARAHILEGLRIALVNIDEIIQVIRAAESTDDARTQLQGRFSLSELQANAILAMRLQSLVGLEQLKVEQEYRERLEEIEGYRRILADENLVLDIIREDLYEIREKFGDERRTEIVGDVADIAREDLIAEEDVVITISHRGYIKRLAIDTYRTQGRGGKGVIAANVREDDFIEDLFIASTHDYLLFFTDKGTVYWLKVYELPPGRRTSAGRALVNVLQLEKDENITSMVPVSEFDDEHFLLMATAHGTVKKTALSAFGKRGSGGIIAVNLADGDRLVGVRMTDGDQDVVLLTHGGRAIRFHETDVRPMGRVAAGVRGIRLKKGDQVVSLAIARPQTSLLTLCELGYGKRTDWEEYPAQKRGGQGVIDIKTVKRNGPVVGAREVTDEDQLMVCTEKGKMIRLSISDIRPIGRNTQGVRIIDVEDGDCVSALALVAEREDDEEPPESETESEPASESE